MLPQELKSVISEQPSRMPLARLHLEETLAITWEMGGGLALDAVLCRIALAREGFRALLSRKLVET